MGRTKSLALVIILACLQAGIPGVSQSTPVLIPGITEPPEMQGAGSEVHALSSDDTAFGKALESVGSNLDESSIPVLDEFVKGHPTYALAHYFRAMAEACGKKPVDISKAKADFQAALLYKGETDPVLGVPDVLPLVAKIAYSEGRKGEAIEMLARVMLADLDSADHIFNAQGTAPNSPQGFCSWSLNDLDELVGSAPKDWRPQVLRGLYFRFFTIFDESYYTQATAAFDKAALLNGRTPVVPYLIGRLRESGVPGSFCTS